MAEATQTQAQDNTTQNTENSGNKIVSLFNKLSMQQKIAAGAGLAVVIALIVGMWQVNSPPDYRVLYSNLSARDGGEIIEALQQNNIPYEFSENGGALLVPAEHVHETRLRLASQGLPKGGNVGLEIMENQKFGITQFAERVNYQRGLEGELARSVQEIDGVESARVHLAMPKPTVFVKEKKKPSASVVINLQPGRVLSRSQVRAIIHLISSSVPDMPAQNVTIVDQDSNLLSEEAASGDNRDDELNTKQLQYVRKIEHDYVKRIENLLQPLFGSDNIRAQVTADIDFSKVEQTAETYKPNQDPAESAVRSKQTSRALNGNDLYPNGVPGALTNQPPVPATAPIVAEGNNVAPDGRGAADNERTTEITSLEDGTTINYEVDRTIRHVVSPSSNIRRLSVAVVINANRQIADDKGKIIDKPVTADEQQKISNLVKDAVGIKQQRGDSLSVQVIDFSPTKTEEKQEDLMTYVSNPDFVMSALDRFLIPLLMFIAAIIVILKVIKPALSPILVKEEEKDQDEQDEKQDKGDKMEEDEEDATPAAIFTPSGEMPDDSKKKMDVAKQVATDNPKIVASVLKEWVND